MCTYVIVKDHLAGFKCFNVHAHEEDAFGSCIKQPRPLLYRPHVRTLKHEKPARWSLSVLLFIT